MGCWLLVAKASSEYRFGVKEGDVIDVVEEGFKLNEWELKYYMVVPITINKADAEAFKFPLYDSGVDELPKDGTTAPNLTGKRKYQVTIADMATAATAANTGIVFDTSKAVDTREKYQPFTDAKVSFNLASVNLVHDKYSGTYKNGTVGS